MNVPKPMIILADSSSVEALGNCEKFVIGQLGQSLDGFIATRTGASKYINHKDGLKHLHALRAVSDAVVIGVGTLNDDDPSLTVRLCEGESPARVIIDPNGRALAESVLFADGGPSVFILTDKNINHPLADRATIVGMDVDHGRMSPLDITTRLSELGFARLLIEGGSRTISAFMDAGCLDRLHLIVAPVLMGGGKAGLTLSGFAAIDQALKPQVTLYSLGCDVLYDCDLRSGGR